MVVPMFVLMMAFRAVVPMTVPMPTIVFSIFVPPPLCMKPMFVPMTFSMIGWLQCPPSRTSRASRFVSAF